MRFGMGLLKNEYGVFHVRRKVMLNRFDPQSLAL